MALTQVSTDGVKNDAITKTKIPANQIEASELADNAVDTNAIADQAVALSKLPHGDGSSDGKFLRANNGADPSFETISTTPADGSITSAKIADGTIVNADINGSAAIAGTKISPDFGSQNIINQADVKIGSKLITRQQGGGHFYLKNNSSGANYSSHFQTYSGGENDNVQTYIHYYHGGYAELLHQGNSSLRTLSNGVQFRNGNNVIGQISPDGLCFGSDTAAANALDDYEEGTFTPTLRGNNTNSSPEISGIGKYTKVGRLVYVIISFQNKNQTYLPSGEYIQIHGLPFTVAGQTQVAPVGMNYKIGFSTNYQYYWYIPTNGTKMWGYYNSNAAAYSAWGTDQWKTAGNIYHENSFTYMTS